MVMLSQDEIATMLRELHEAVQQGDRQPGEFSVSEYATVNQMTYDAAHREIEKLVRAGLVKVRDEKVVVGSRWQRLYKKVSQE